MNDLISTKRIFKFHDPNNLIPDYNDATSIASSSIFHIPEIQFVGLSESLIQKLLSNTSML